MIKDRGHSGALAGAFALALVLAGCAETAPPPAQPSVVPTEAFRITAMEVEVAPELELSWPQLQFDAGVVRYCRDATLVCDDPLTRPRTRREYIEARIDQLVTDEAGAMIAPQGSGPQEAVATVLVREIDIAAGAESAFIGGAHEMVADVILTDPRTGERLLASGPIGAELDAGSGTLWTEGHSRQRGDDPAPALARTWGMAAAAWLDGGS